jgi:peroxiredoxin
MFVRCVFKTIAISYVLTALLAAPAIQAAMPKIGAAAPDFALKSSSGKNLRLSEHRGEVVMINFRAPGSGPCRHELPLLNRLHEQYRKTGFTLLGVNIDDRQEAAQDMAKKLGITFPVLFDTDKRVSRLYDVNAMPSTVLIDRDGKVRYIHLGYRAGYETSYETQIRELLKQ